MKPIPVLRDLRRLFLSLAAIWETAVRREPWCLLLFFFFRRFRNTNRHLIFCDVHCGGPDISRNAGFLIMMPGLDWIMSSPLISPRKPSFMCESLFFL